MKNRVYMQVKTNANAKTTVGLQRAMRVEICKQTPTSARSETRTNGCPDREPDDTLEEEIDGFG